MNITLKQDKTFFLCVPTVFLCEGKKNHKITNCSYTSTIMLLFPPNIRVSAYIALHNVKKLTHPVSFSLIDYRNSLFTGLPEKLIDRLQLVQKTSAQGLAGPRKNEHITSDDNILDLSVC